MPNEFVIRNGAQISSSLSVTGSTNMNGSSDVLNALATAGGTAPVFNVFGTAGQLFSVTDGLQGSLFSVNNISGLPFLEVFSDSRLVAGGFNKNTFIISGSQVAIGKTITTGVTFDISGSTQLTGSLVVGDGIFSFPFFRITGSTGNISIGTTSSVAKLNVAGTTNVVSLYGSTTEGVVFDVNGPSGQLFSVVDGLSGSLFSVNTISGLPIIEAFSDATIRMGNYSLPALIITGSQAIITGSITSASFASTASFVNPLIQSVRLTGSLFISASFSTSSAALSAYKSGSTVLDIQGSQGQLFSVIDSLTGSLMSVNDVSGLPILEVFSNDTVVMGTYGNPAVIISGSIANVTGSLVTQGQTIDPALIWFMS
jgi:hypothetical protein